MDWPNELELELASMAQGGDAVGRYENRAVFASGGLPGERVRVRLHDRQKAFARGRVTFVLEPVAERVPSFCPCETTCGAADWRWISYAAQRRFKREILREQLLHLGGLDVSVREDDEADVAPPTGYRTTAELHVAGERIGYFRPGSRDVSDIPACCLHHPLINEALAIFRTLPRGNATLRGMTLRCNSSANQVIAVLDGRGSVRPLAQHWRAACPQLVGVTNARGQVLDGQPLLVQQVGDVRFEVGATSFFQINYLQWDHLVGRVRTLLDPQPDTRLLDVYCGVGLFALSLAREVAAVVGVEEWQPAIEDARRSAKLNSITNARFEVGDAAQRVAKLNGTFDRVVLDPPRRGCGPEVLDALIGRAPERIVYVSCHPGTLARDCKQLAAAGYTITSAETIDMFPHTHHVESIVLLERM